MTWFTSGDKVVVNEKANIRRCPVKPGTQGTVMEVVFENRRKGKQWLMIELRGRQGNVIGRTKVPRNWLRLRS